MKRRQQAWGLLLWAALCMPSAVMAQSLLELYQRALETNPTLKSREFGVDQAKAQKDQAASRLLPQVSANSAYYWNDYSESGSPNRRYDGTRSAVQARQALFDLAGYFRLTGARFLVDQSEKAREAARMDLGGDLVDRYLTVLQTGDDIANLEAEKAAIEGQMKRLQFMYERGLSKVTDLYEVQAYYQGLRTREIEARNAKAVALERLREITGWVTNDVAPLARASFPPVPRREEEWVNDAALYNPNLLALKSAIEAARQLIESGRAEHLPRLDLTASRVNSDQGYDNRLVPSYNVGTVGVQVTVPIYEGGRVQASVAEARARYEIAREQHEGALREIERDARTAYLSALASHARIDSTNEEVRALEKVVDGQQKSYDLGVSTVIDLLIAQRRLYKSRSDQSKARYDHIRDLTLLRVRAGSLTQQFIEELDAWMAKGTTRRMVQSGSLP